MRLVIGMVVLAGACAGPAPPDPGGTSPDAAQGSGSGSGVPLMCPLPDSMPDTGPLTAFKAQMCNVNGTAGAQHWYRVSATLPSGAMDFVQLELWDGLGAFTGTTVAPGTYQITGAE